MSNTTFLKNLARYAYSTPSVKKNPLMFSLQNVSVAVFYEFPVFAVEVLKLRDYETIGYLKSDDFYVGKESGNGFNTLASEGPKHKEKYHGYWKVILTLGYGMCPHSCLNLTFTENYIVRLCFYFSSRNSEGTSWNYW